MDASCGQGQLPAQLDSGGMRPLSLTAVLRVRDAWGLGRKRVYDQIGEEVNSWTKKHMLSYWSYLDSSFVISRALVPWETDSSIFSYSLDPLFSS